VSRPSFPKNLQQFQAQFASDEACADYLAACRWPEGFACPRCSHGAAYALAGRRRWQCASCRYQVSVTAGTVLHNSKTPLTPWFWAAYWMTTDKRGLSALLLQRQLGISRYETAWMILHKLRRATVNASRETLRSEVELDETWVGGPQGGLKGSRQLKGRKAALVLVAVERRGGASGRVRMEVIPDFTGATMRDFVTRNITVGTTIYTDGLKSFDGLTAAGYSHVSQSLPRRLLRQGGKSAVPLADRMIGNLQNWLVGTYHGVSRGQLQVYLDEFVFRTNRRREPRAAFQTLLGLGSGRGPTSYEQIRHARDRKLLGLAETTG
jgi:transposase-like protein